MASSADSTAVAETGPPNKPVMQQIFQFSDTTVIENIHVRPNGHLLFTTLNSGDLYTIDPSANEPSPTVVASLDATGLTGIATLSAEYNQFAVAGGIHIPFGFEEGSMEVYIVSLGSDSEESGGNKGSHFGDVQHIIPVPTMINGMASLPDTPFRILGVDSVGGQVIRIDATTEDVDVAAADPSLGPSASFPLGVNGIRVRGDRVYFTNSGQGTFASYPIDAHGTKIGDVEVIATLPQLPAGFNNAYDDFAFDNEGNAYVTLHSSSLMKITPEGHQTVLVDGTDQGVKLFSPTSAALSLDGKAMYVCTGGTTVGERKHGGQIVKITL